MGNPNLPQDPQGGLLKREIPRTVADREDEQGDIQPARKYRDHEMTDGKE